MLRDITFVGINLTACQRRQQKSSYDVVALKRLHVGSEVARTDPLLPRNRQTWNVSRYQQLVDSPSNFANSLGGTGPSNI